MRFKTTLVLLLVALLLGAYIVFVERGSQSMDARREQARKAFRVHPDKVDFLRIEADAVDASLRRRGGHWELVEPLNTRADAGTIDRLLYGLEMLQKGEVITAADREKFGTGMADYGLEQPEVTLTVGEQGARRSLLIGSRARLGEHVYAKEGSVDDIMAVPGDILLAVPEALDDLRDRALLVTERSAVRRLGLRRTDGFVQLARKENGGWRLQQPVAARAERMEVVKLLDDLYGLRIEAFVADDVGDPAAYGLESTPLQLTVWTEDEEAGRTLLIGEPVEEHPELVYARWENGDSVYGVPARVRDSLEKPLQTLRDHSLLPYLPFQISMIRIAGGKQDIEMVREDNGTWLLTEPGQEVADVQRVQEVIETWMRMEVDGFVDNVGTNRDTVGLNDPVYTLTFAVRPGDEAEQDDETETPDESQAISITLGRMGDDKSLYLKNSWESTVYEAADDTLQALSLDPLFYRDRVVLSIDREAVRTLQLKIAGKTEIVERRQAADPFVVAGGKSGQVNKRSLDERLTLLRELSVVRFVDENPDDMAVYGLDTPSAVLTVGLSGDAGISKTLLFGDSENGEVFASIRGQDVVFTVGEQDWESLTRPLLIKELTEEEPVEAEEEDAQ